MNDAVTVFYAQRRLGIVWLTGGAIVFVLILAQTIGGKYGTRFEEAWSWVLPSILPTLSLIIGALVAEARKPQTKVTVTSFIYRISLGLSVFYLLLVLATIVFQPLSGVPPLELLQRSNLWLGPLQGLVGLCLGVFFVSRKG